MFTVIYRMCVMQSITLVCKPTRIHTHTHGATQKWISSSVGQETRLQGPDHIIVCSRVIIKASNITAQIHQTWTPWREKMGEWCAMGVLGVGKEKLYEKRKREGVEEEIKKVERAQETKAERDRELERLSANYC